MYDEKLFDQRLNAFTPEPLITPQEPHHGPIEIPMVEEGPHNVDLAKVNYLGFLDCPQIKKTSEELIREYGVGTCGPRAFYGTTDVHLELEEAIAKFLNLEESIVYSYGFVAISSSIAAYCKKNDTVFVDENANFPIEQGLIAAKSKVVKFAHNSPEDLRNKLEQTEAKEKKKSRKFLIIEGISWKTGKLCPLPDFLRVAEEYKMRVFLEESYTIGIFGETGRGLTEYYRIDPTRVDMIFGTLEGAIGSIGGFCAGSNLTIEHQRLSGSGYIFSASLPTYLVKVVLKALELFGEKPKQFAMLTKDFHHFLEGCGFNVVSHPEAPFKLIKAAPEIEEKIYNYCKEKGVNFIHDENGLIINLNVKLLEEEEKMEKIKDVFKGASELL